MKIVWRFVGLGLVAWSIVLLSGGQGWWSGWGSIGLVFGLMLFLATWLAGGFLAIVASLLLLGTGIIRIFFPGGTWWHWVLLALATFVVGIISIATLSDDVEHSGASSPEVGHQSPDSPSTLTGPPSLPAPSRIRTQLNPSRVIAGMTPALSRKPQARYDRDCAKCGETSRPGRRFCGSCGEPLEVLEP